MDSTDRPAELEPAELAPAPDAAERRAEERAEQRPAGRRPEAFDDGTRQAMASLAAMLAFVGIGLGLAAFGAYKLSSDRPGAPPVFGEEAEDTGAETSGARDEGTTSGSAGRTSGGSGDAAAQPSGPRDEAEARKIETLVEQMDAEAYQARIDAANELRRLGERARPALERALRHNSAEVRYRAETLLEELNARRR